MTDAENDAQAPPAVAPPESEPTPESSVEPVVEEPTAEPPTEPPVEPVVEDVLVTDDAVPTEPLIEDPAPDVGLDPPVGEEAPDAPPADDVAAVIENVDPDEATLIETEQAIERAVAAPEAPAIVEPQPLEELPIVDLEVPGVPEIPEVPQETVEEVFEGATEEMLDAPSVISKKSKRSVKFAAAKAKIAGKVVPRLILARAPKEVAPLVDLLAKKKKDGDDISGLVETCIAAVG